MAVRALNRHPLEHGVERHLGYPGIRAFNVVAVDPALCSGDQNRQLRGIADAGLGITSNLGIAAGGRCEQQLGVVRAPELAHAHDAGRERACLIRADDGGTAERFNGR